MQLVSRLMDHVLRERGQRTTICVATSGDTGGAAVEAFRGRSQVDLIVLYPHNRISDVQRHMMTTAADKNVHAVAVEGTFDDCQALVKAMFNHHAFADRVSLAGVNSINWARIVAQAVYYFTAAVALGAPHRKVAFTVPTGNFGDIFAGYVARRMGLPVDRLVVATNTNDILARTLSTGAYEPRDVVATSSPSMDIQVSSNFERLLFESLDRDAPALKRLMNGLTQSGSFTIPAKGIAAIRETFAAGRASEAETSATIANVQSEAGYLLDPHTAVGVSVAREHELGSAPVVTLATAHPAKFPAAVKAATGIEPALPAWLSDLYERQERVDVLANDQDAVEAFIRARSRAGRS
jgi:threonine synthase